MKNIQNRILLNIDDDGIAWVTLNRPEKLNALDMEMFKALDKTIKLIKSNHDVRCVVVKGEGPDFCTGLDVGSIIKKPMSGIRLLFKWLPGNSNLAQRVSTKWRGLAVPVIMAISGRCWGGGLQIALGGDFRIAEHTASFSIMENHWGLIPDMGGNKALSYLLPMDQAMKLAMTAEEFDASKAKELGIITDVTNDLNKSCRDFANRLMNRSPDAISAIKRLYTTKWHRSERAMLAAESLLQVRVLTKRNQKIAVARAKGKAIPFQNSKIR
ncbi:crotonase/enoyl-CoA hydratase family protein [Psychrosphaera sp. B3R10]|uniref:crotonase/enoyl-CoA hydratase family protein n=1 Tax=unclassified Psychrosphaera TaxID=2641570 RepID=UPI001C08FDAE|nr:MULTISPECIES: crotonase/enoyl-CoA hydratase family protein [unclassified Psychrosphaera]MBU2882815.1 crotonase/enoyl-CoA hydratase family protein [Psychrosphaera sp. I2R16]MBU2988035.1 crotonase/enoyl-CoA hydratase family protein [Psychrosphaera sp. B3R10]MDO6721055.1 crotonase/enoyl-CoA hydratase family protein [Psychrosphaera sp. 1_MG-2023]